MPQLRTISLKGGARPRHGMRFALFGDGPYLARRLVLLVAGSVISAYGIALAIEAGFGNVALVVLRQSVSRTFGIAMGQASLATSLIMIGFAFLCDRRPSRMGTLVHQVVCNVFVDAFSRVHSYGGFVPINSFFVDDREHFAVCDRGGSVCRHRYEQGFVRSGDVCAGG